MSTRRPSTPAPCASPASEALLRATGKASRAHNPALAHGAPAAAARAAGADPTATALKACSTRLVAVAPLLMREFRTEMRRSAPHDLSVPLFRSLILAGNRPGATVSDLANHLGVTLPTASVAVGKLAARGLLQTPAEGQRRSLQLTRSGAQVVEQARQNATLAFEQRLASLPAQALGQIDAALAALENALGATPAALTPGSARPATARAAPLPPTQSPAVQAGSAPVRRPARRAAPAVSPQPAPVETAVPATQDGAPA